MTSLVNLFLWVTIGSVVWLLKQCWDQVFEDIEPQPWRGFVLWMAKGLAGPVLVWVMLGGGLWPGSTPLIPELAGWRGKAGFGEAVLQATGPVALLAASLWVAVSAGWLTALAGQRVRNRSEFRTVVLFWLSVLALPAWAIWSLVGPYGTGVALSLWLLPVCWFTASMAPERVSAPCYSKAIARTKFGRYADAEQAVIAELEHHAEDFDGWLMLAELYATKFHDLGEADRTVRQLSTQPGLNAMQISLAFNRLADWHLKHGQDPLAARAALGEIIRLLPETHASRMAGQRLAQIARSREEWLEQQQPKALALPALSDSLDHAAGGPEAGLAPAVARERAQRCVERLREDPNRTEAREEFARLLASPLGQTATAIDQLQLLLGLTDQPEIKRAEWLALIATWQEHQLADPAAARASLQRLIREFPQTPQAFAAQRKLSRMETEERIQARLRNPDPPSPRLRVT